MNDLNKPEMHIEALDISTVAKNLSMRPAQIINPTITRVTLKGRADLGFYWNLGLFFFFPLTVYIGSYWGLNGVMYSLLMLMIFLSIPSWYFMVKPLCGAGFKEYFWQILKPFIFTLIGGISVYSVSTLFGIKNMLIDTVVLSLVMGVIVLILNILYNRTFIDILLELIGKRKKHDK